jgi:HlyD family secretion protein
MDIPRKSAARRKKIIRIAIGAVVVAAIPVVTWALGRLKPAAPSVERAVVWVGTVKRGPMVRKVSGLGTLVPEEILWIPATTEGRVVRRLVLPGTRVKRDTVIVELSSPELEQALLDAELKLKGAEADLTKLKVTLQSDRLTQQASAETIASQARTAKLTADRDKELNRLGLKADLEAKLSEANAEDLANREKTERERLKIGLEAISAQIAVQEAQIEQYRAMYKLKLSQVEALKVRAGVDGVLAELTPEAEVGSRVAAGTRLARVVQPDKLKAELKIPETQAKDVALGQMAEVDTRNGIIRGVVSRIDPAAVNSTVTVDVRLEDELPKGARPDLSVDGTIEIEKLADVVYVDRPTSGQPHSTIMLFKLDPDGKGANRVQVKLGRASVGTIEVLDGLRVGDQVILSDMAQWDAYDRIRLN